MVQGKINIGSHTDNPAGRHSIRSNHCPPVHNATQMSVKQKCNIKKFYIDTGLGTTSTTLLVPLLLLLHDTGINAYVLQEYPILQTLSQNLHVICLTSLPQVHHLRSKHGIITYNSHAHVQLQKRPALYVTLFT